MIQRALADSGPLVALFNNRDRHHAAALQFFAQRGSRLQLLTTWEVVAEVTCFLDFSAETQGDFLDWLHDGAQHGLLTLAALEVQELPDLSRTMRRYADRPMDLAHASLLCLANKTGVTDIITIDRADFAIYRTNKRKAFHNIFTPESAAPSRPGRTR